MATPNPETSDIRRRGRQRLTGAIVLVLLLVVFVPMVLDPEPRQEKKEPALAIPPREGAPALPAPAPAAKSEAAPKVEAAPREVAPKSEELKTPVPRMAEKPSKPEAGKAVEPRPAPVAAVEAKGAEPRLEGFAIQVGAFGDEEKLRQAREKLAAARIAHFIERLPTGLTRLRVGPYPTRDAAEKAVAGVKAAGLDGKVVTLP